MNNDAGTVWHKGEVSIQKLAGTYERMVDIGPKFIREFMPQQHRDFFSALTMIYIGYMDHRMQTRASLLFGVPNFIQSPSETELIINTQSSLGDFINDDIKIGDRVGLLGIEFDTKRRNRANAVITDINQKNIRLSILQSYGNCPKYIQPKTLVHNQGYGDFSLTTDSHLNQVDKDFISSADAFFIASHFDDGQQGNDRGADISHRGGSAGFVSINPKGQLLIDDYPGNGFFNTLGNLIENPLASLLFCDWYSGNALHISVSSKVIWHDDENHRSHLLTTTKDTGSEQIKRTLCFTPSKVERFVNALAYRTASY
ncbi:pyridoxamine 5'-phosphate oxidase family protein [Paraglaciecola marina]|uniref:pyridoxamine 5'-phosphate oxidase family protein n=1 Tax=Paraglaciecola marina TaxID=2500157 RepID=UPI00105E9795|nr:pyridoxamine 5'-phosphate oxidase family protein [Paraglaciecola marina]